MQDLKQQVDEIKEDFFETISVGEEKLYVTILNTIDERKKGLQGKKALPEDRGYFFIYEQERPSLCFWMKETYIPIDLAYISKDGKINEIHQMEPESTERIYNNSPAQYVLEVQQGWFNRHEVGIDDYISLES